MRKITAAAAVLLALAALYLFLEQNPSVCFGLSCVQVELALTPEQQQQGLMHRTSLKGGMLFVFPREEKHGFWMNNMNFPIDLVWISAGKQVVGISQNVPPCADSCPVYYPNSPVKYVLEVPANYSLAKGIAVGGRAFFLGIG